MSFREEENLNNYKLHKQKLTCIAMHDNRKDGYGQENHTEAMRLELGDIQELETKFLRKMNRNFEEINRMRKNKVWDGIDS